MSADFRRQKRHQVRPFRSGGTVLAGATGSKRASGEETPHALFRFRERHAVRHDALRRPPAGGWRRRAENHENALVTRAPDQAAETLRDPQADDRVVIGGEAETVLARGMQDVGPSQGTRFADNEAQRTARHVDAVAHRIGAEQAGMLVLAEDVDQGSGVERVSMLGIERQARFLQRRGDAGMDLSQPPDRGEEAERAAARRLEEAQIGRRRAGAS